MAIFQQLKNNKGTVSSALGKELAKKALAGDLDILKEAVGLTTYEFDIEKSKNIRAGAAKIVEKVAEKKSELVAPYLEKLLLALEVVEPQTRWMIIHIFGLCAKDNPKIAMQGILYAERFIQANQGVCLSGSAELALGNIGGLGTKQAKKVLPILLEDLEKSPATEIDCVLRALAEIFENLDKQRQIEVKTKVEKYKNAPRKSTQKRVANILKMSKE